MQIKKIVLEVGDRVLTATVNREQEIVVEVRANHDSLNPGHGTINRKTLAAGLPFGELMEVVRWLYAPITGKVPTGSFCELGDLFNRMQNGM